MQWARDKAEWIALLGDDAGQAYLTYMGVIKNGS